MDRRTFIGKAGLAAGGAASASVGLSAPAIARDMPSITWRLASSFPRQRDILFRGAEMMADTVAAMTGDKFRIEVFAAGEVVPASQALNAVQDATVEIAHAFCHDHADKDPAFAIASTIPFGLNARQQSAWLHHGGGSEAVNAFLSHHDLFAIPGGNAGVQMGGWFRSEVTRLADLDGLRMRIGGLGGTVVAALGVAPQELDPDDIHGALRNGTLDAAAFAGPADDEALGLVEVAPVYHYPAFWEPGPSAHFLFDRQKYVALPEAYKKALDAAAKMAGADMLARYDARNSLAIRGLVAKGAQLRPFPHDVLDAAYHASMTLYDGFSLDNAGWKTLYEPWKTFRSQSYEWFRLAEHSHDSDVYDQQAAGA